MTRMAEIHHGGCRDGSLFHLRFMLRIFKDTGREVRLFVDGCSVYVPPKRATPTVT
jgi:hypothetical protein